MNKITVSLLISIILLALVCCQNPAGSTPAATTTTSTAVAVSAPSSVALFTPATITVTVTTTTTTSKSVSSGSAVVLNITGGGITGEKDVTLSGGTATATLTPVSVAPLYVSATVDGVTSSAVNVAVTPNSAVFINGSPTSTTAKTWNLLTGSNYAGFVFAASGSTLTLTYDNGTSNGVYTGTWTLNTDGTMSPSTLTKVSGTYSHATIPLTGVFSYSAGILTYVQNGTTYTYN